MNYPIILARNLTKNPGKAYFEHGGLLKMRRVPEEAFFDTECQFRTVGGGFWYRMLQSQKGERYCLQRIYQAARKEATIAQSAARNADASKKITANGSKA